jgi:hypothetical protein
MGTPVAKRILVADDDETIAHERAPKDLPARAGEVPEGRDLNRDPTARSSMEVICF